ncbi:hypothetical protein A2886_01740 [candidate division WWE3 bacterium RIFCSPHIGHO2_01_FULL_42_13]|uniref:Ribosomal subunit interface protein n=1 Tax=candidate division WWE3 bacterium RIFCSPHIGHO2_01_FULL_42_13 TaxID=1802617 RepID=A0A1F4UR88_UNCKA|nr:MAG: hypothetical protein A2886_01740 [candidate division WWE3 bacterium RIFCSPHIGHO2_01_FULL_42_13]
MPLQVTSDNMEVTPSMKALAEDKLSKILNKLTDTPGDLINTRVVLNKGDGEGTFDTKIELSIAGKMIVGEDTDFTLESSLIKAVEDALRQYEKMKSKRTKEEWEGRRKMKMLELT